MCFSANLSFSASAVLTLMSFLLIARNKRGRYYFLTFIPLFFGIQQFIEGMVWLKGDSIWKNYYLFFALSFWPIYIPLSLYVADREKGHLFCLGVGFALAFSFFFIIPQFRILPSPYSIHYFNQNYSSLTASVLYAISTVPPLFISTLKHMWILGILAISSALIINYIDKTIFISMWCFWAALFSAGLFFILRRE